MTEVLKRMFMLARGIPDESATAKAAETIVVKRETRRQAMEQAVAQTHGKREDIDGNPLQPDEHALRMIEDANMVGSQTLDMPANTTDDQALGDATTTVADIDDGQPVWWRKRKTASMVSAHADQQTRSWFRGKQIDDGRIPFAQQQAPSNIHPVVDPEMLPVPQVRVGLDNNNLQVWNPPNKTCFALNKADSDFAASIGYPNRELEPARWDEDPACCAKRKQTTPCGGGARAKDKVAKTFKGFPKTQEANLEEMAAFPLEVQYEMDIKLLMDGKKAKAKKRLQLPPNVDSCDVGSFQALFDKSKDKPECRGANPAKKDKFAQDNVQNGVQNGSFAQDEMHDGGQFEQGENFRNDVAQRKYSAVEEQFQQMRLMNAERAAQQPTVGIDDGYTDDDMYAGNGGPTFIPTMTPAPQAAGWWSGNGFNETPCPSGSGVSRCNLRN